jgi:hypothetical protein
VSGREWKPGDVAVLTTPDGREFMAVRTEGGSTGDYWSAPKGWPRGSVSDECAIRPLVVIDPEDREQVERLIRASVGTHSGCPDVLEISAAQIDHMQAALREFANPTPVEVFEHFVVSTGVDRLVVNGKREPLRSLCGKSWQPDEQTVAVGKCPECVARVESGWTK